MILLPIQQICVKVIEVLESFPAAAEAVKIATAPLLDVGAHPETTIGGQAARLFIGRYTSRDRMPQREDVFRAFTQHAMEETARVDALGELFGYHDFARVLFLVRKK